MLFWGSFLITNLAIYIWTQIEVPIWEERPQKADINYLTTLKEDGADTEIEWRELRIWEFMGRPLNCCTSRATAFCIVACQRPTVCGRWVKAHLFSYLFSKTLILKCLENFEAFYGFYIINSLLQSTEASMANLDECNLVNCSILSYSISTFKLNGNA